jgi:purine-binding chemotaxis protein CheW
MINLRGEIVTAFDMRRVLRRAERDPDAVPTGVVVQHEGRPVGLLVDAIGDVLDVHAEQFEPPPETLQGAARELIDGAYKLDTHLLLSLDVRKATTTRG